jgi:hypothetical protein
MEALHQAALAYDATHVLEQEIPAVPAFTLHDEGGRVTHAFISVVVDDATPHLALLVITDATGTKKLLVDLQQLRELT